VVWDGVTVTEVPLTTPTPWSMLVEDAPVVDQESSVEDPAVIVEGVAVNELMTGLEAGGGGAPGPTLSVVLQVVVARPPLVNVPV
jgi:hypothetical protein